MPADEEAVIQKLETLIRLTAFGLIDGKKQKDQIRILSAAGLKPIRIAEMLGTSSNTVKVCMSNLRKNGELPNSRSEEK